MNFAALNDTIAFEYENLIRADNRPESVRNHYAGDNGLAVPLWRRLQNVEFGQRASLW